MFWKKTCVHELTRTHRKQCFETKTFFKPKVVIYTFCEENNGGVSINFGCKSFYPGEIMQLIF